MTHQAEVIIHPANTFAWIPPVDTNKWPFLSAKGDMSIYCRLSTDNTTQLSQNSNLYVGAKDGEWVVFQSFPNQIRGPYTFNPFGMYISNGMPQMGDFIFVLSPPNEDGNKAKRSQLKSV